MFKNQSPKPYNLKSNQELLQENDKKLDVLARTYIKMDWANLPLNSDEVAIVIDKVGNLHSLVGTILSDEIPINEIDDLVAGLKEDDIKDVITDLLNTFPNDNSKSEVQAVLNDITSLYLTTKAHILNLLAEKSVAINSFKM